MIGKRSRGVPLLIAAVVAGAVATAGPVSAQADAPVDPAALTVEAASGPKAPAAPEAVPEVSDDSVLVRFNPGTYDATARIDKAGAKIESSVTPDGWIEVSTADGQADEVLAALDADPTVAAVEPNYIRSIATAPTDPLWGNQDDYLAGLRVPEAFDETDGTGQIIAVIDTGVDLDHPDLTGRLVAGWDFVNNDATPQDDHGHGTAVASIAVANDSNAVHGSGVAPGAQVMPLKVLASNGNGTDANIAAAIDFARTSGLGVDVINLSLGGYGSSSVLSNAVSAARSAGIVVVAASGNDGVEEPSYPAAYPGVIAVGATDDAGTATYWSNRGNHLDVAAPGLNLTASAWNDTFSHSLSGTSFSSPIVAGIAALVRAENPGFTEAQVTARIQATAKDRGFPGYDAVYGYGTVDAYSAVTNLSLPAAATSTPSGNGEPNGTLGQATLVGASAIGAIAPETDVDWYAFDSVPGSWVIKVIPPQPGSSQDAKQFDPIITLYNSSGTQLAQVDNEWENVTETAELGVSVAGRYYLKVSNYNSAASPGNYSVTLTYTPIPDGYWMVGATGSVYAFGGVKHYGSFNSLMVDLEPTPSGKGYWQVAIDGTVGEFGDAEWYGDVSASQLFSGETVTSLSRTASGDGYWIFTSRGRVFAFGDAPFLGDMRNVALAGPVLDSVSTPSGAGYFMVASDGGVFAFGNATFAGSMGGRPLNAPVQSLVPDADGNGYWLVALDGGIFAFNAEFRGSMGGTRLNKPITGMVRFGAGYLMVGEDGGIFNFSNKPFFGSLGGNPPANPIVSVAASG